MLGVCNARVEPAAAAQGVFGSGVVPDAVVQPGPRGGTGGVDDVPPAPKVDETPGGIGGIADTVAGESRSPPADLAEPGPNGTVLGTAAVPCGISGDGGLPPTPPNKGALGVAGSALAVAVGGLVASGIIIFGGIFLKRLP